MIDQNAVPAARHVEGDALIGDAARCPAVLVPGLHTLPVLDEAGEPLAEAIDALSRFQRKLVDDVRLHTSLIQIMIARQHRRRLTVPLHVSQVAEPAPGNDGSIFLKAIAELLPVYPHTKASGLHDNGVFGFGNLHLLRILKNRKRRLMGIVPLEVNDLNADRVRRDRAECNRQAGHIDGVSLRRHLPERYQQTHTVLKPFHLPYLRRIVFPHPLAPEPVTFRKPHPVPPSQNSVLQADLLFPDANSVTRLCCFASHPGTEFSSSLFSLKSPSLTDGLPARSFHLFPVMFFTPAVRLLINGPAATPSFHFPRGLPTRSTE